MKLFWSVFNHCASREGVSTTTRIQVFQFQLLRFSYPRWNDYFHPFPSFATKRLRRLFSTTMTNSMSLWLCTNNSTSSSWSSINNFFLESPHIPNWKILEEHKVISYIHHDKNGGSCNFLAKKNKLPITSCCGGNNSLNSNYSFKIEIVHTTILGCPEFSSFAKFWSASFSHQTMNHHFSERDMTVHFPPLLSRDQSNHSQTIFQGKSIRTMRSKILGSCQQWDDFVTENYD